MYKRQAGFNVTGPKDIVIEGENGSLDKKDLSKAVERALKVDRTKVVKSAKKYTWDVSTDQFIESLVSIK